MGKVIELVKAETVEDMGLHLSLTFLPDIILYLKLETLGVALNPVPLPLLLKSHR